MSKTRTPIAKTLWSEGKTWHCEILPVTQVPDQSGGKGGTVWALRLDVCDPSLRAKLCPPESTALTPVKQPLKGIPEARHFDVTADKRAFLKPILEHPKNTAERAAAFNAVAGQLHKFENDLKRFSVSTLRGWVATFEKRGRLHWLRKRGLTRARRGCSWSNGGMIGFAFRIPSRQISPP